MKQVYILILVCLLGCRSSEKTSRQFRHFDKESLKNDLAYLYDIFHWNHPGFYLHSDPEEIDLLITRLEESIPDSMTEPDFLKLISEFNSVIRCVHSDIKPSDNYKMYLDTAQCYVPFELLKVNDSYHIYHPLTSDAVLNECPRVMSINGKPIDEIVNEILVRIPADGKNETRKFNVLQKQFNKYLAMYVFPGVNSFDLEIVTENNEIQLINIKGIEKDVYKAKWNAEYHAPNQPPISFSFDKNVDVGVLMIRSFRNDLMNKFEINYHDYLKTVFDSLEKSQTEKLIIDLRGNGGGYSEYGAQLLAFLSDTAFQYCNRMVVNHSELDSRLQYDIPETFGDFPNGLMCPLNTCLWTNHSVLGWRQPEEKVFEGTVIFLIDGGCVSTTSEVATVAHKLKLGSFIGEEVGGSYMGDSGGVLGWGTLPNTGIQVRMAIVKYVLSEVDAFNGHGVIPEVIVPTSIVDVRNGKDVVLEKAVEMIQ